MKSMEVCMKLLRAESESEVSDIVASVAAMRDQSNWYPIDDRESNFNVVTNQASTGSKALTELCTNMVDAYLMKQARIKGIPLAGDNAPQSVIEGVMSLARITGMNRGRLFEVDADRHLREFAEKNLIIAVNGGTQSRTPVCFTFVDSGEGQHPRDFADTFLSLKSGHKSKIPFVQGKYNMGSSGVLGYCGDRWYKLIISRRHTEDGHWGWVLIRKRPTSGPPIAEYFAPRKQVASFSLSEMRPCSLRDGNVDEFVSLTSGTVVKLYNYYLEKPPSFGNIRELLDRNMTSTVLPFRIMDYRYPPVQGRGRRRADGVDERTFCGLEHHLMKHATTREDADRDEQFEPGHEEPVGEIDHPVLGRISIRAIVFEKNPPGWIKKNQDATRVFHSVNGQVMFKQSRGYLSTTCKLPGLVDRIVIIVDASELSEGGQNDVWKGDRENIRRNAQGLEYQDLVTERIRTSPYLKALQDRLAREDIDEDVIEVTRDIFQHLVATNPSVAQLLPEGMLIKVPVGRPPPTPYEGKFDPTKLELIGRSLRQSGIELTPNQDRHIVFETDAANDFLTRASNRGRLEFRENQRNDEEDRKFSFLSNLRDGKLAVTIRAMAGQVSVGEEYAMEASLGSDSMAFSITEPFNLVVVRNRQTPPPGPRPPRPPQPDGPEEAISRPPETRWLTRDGRVVLNEQSVLWDERHGDFGDQDGGYAQVLTAGEGDQPGLVRFYINYDNAHFQRRLQSVRDSLTKGVTVNRYRWGMLLAMMGFEDALRRTWTEEQRERIEVHGDEIRRAVARGASTIVLSLIEDLPKIVNPASSGEVVVE